ncbi:hypothetical protein HHK36_021597 [Tetracentron sinense]|uniref:Peptidase A1 domain-containing protein n=1 Tax=Tetracentron sinense TaxID=13715 RepID=A0A834YQ14_TETSI|nr:hypothetical protein HHK36_021597 [Tetracentron sinense]
MAMATTSTLQIFFLLLSFTSLSCATTKPSSFVVKLIRSNSSISLINSPSATLSSSANLSTKYSVNDIRTGLTPDPDGKLYLAKFWIGTPPFEILTAMDTGSNLFWIQCLPCDHCFRQKGPYFNPSKSSTFSNMDCQNQTCPKPRRRPCDDRNRCAYGTRYAGGLYTKGTLAYELLTLDDDTDNGSKYTFPNVIFGCGRDNWFYEGNGILGLGPSPFSLAAQFGRVTKPQFSYCFSNNSDPSSGGHLVFGDGAHLEGAATPIVEGSTEHYHLSLFGISVGQDRLVIPPGTFERLPHGSGGVVIDSGATMTYLAQSAYDKLAEKINGLLNQISQPVKVKDYKLCYKGNMAQDLAGFPTITFHFAGDTDLQAENWTFFRQVNEGAFCMTIVPTSYGKTIIGNLVQQGYNVGFWGPSVVFLSKMEDYSNEIAIYVWKITMEDYSNEISMYGKLHSLPMSWINSPSATLSTAANPSTKYSVNDIRAGPYFNPSKSSTFSNMNCQNQTCPRPCDARNRCTYVARYADGSYTKGTLAYELLTFDTDNGRKTVVIFGISYLSVFIFDGIVVILGFCSCDSYHFRTMVIFGISCFSVIIVDGIMFLDLSAMSVFIFVVFVYYREEKMCHPGLPSVSFREFAMQGRWFALQAPLVVEAVAVAPGAQTVVVGAASGGGSSKQCLCAPTRHPGSFRCRHHHGEYEWGGRLRVTTPPQ